MAINPFTAMAPSDEDKAEAKKFEERIDARVQSALDKHQGPVEGLTVKIPRSEFGKEMPSTKVETVLNETYSDQNWVTNWVKDGLTLTAHKARKGGRPKLTEEQKAANKAKRDAEKALAEAAVAQG